MKSQGQGPLPGRVEIPRSQPKFQKAPLGVSVMDVSVVATTAWLLIVDFYLCLQQGHERTGPQTVSHARDWHFEK